MDPIFKPIYLGTHLVPGIWRYMLPEEVMYFRVDPEKKSSCFDCPQVKAFGFHPGIRCCTYYPRVPNFLIGMALLDPETRGPTTQFVNSGYSIPEGSQLSPAQLRESLQFLSSSDAKGQVVCPLLDLDSKKCKIYAYRSGVCSTFFCIHDQGEDGVLFWENLQDLVSQVETALSQWVMGQLGFDLEDYFSRFDELGRNLEDCSDPVKKTWAEKAREILFGSWSGRELEFFKACAEVILANRNDLFVLAGQQKLYQTEAYDRASRQFFERHFPMRLIDEALPLGEPLGIDKIWYSVQLSHRNLQLSRMKNNP